MTGVCGLLLWRKWDCQVDVVVIVFRQIDAFWIGRDIFLRCTRDLCRHKILAGSEADKGEAATLIGIRGA